MKNNKFKRSIKKGFTLVELVVVIAVIAILAGVSVGAYFGITNSARDSKLLQEAKTVSTTLKLANGHGAELSSKGLTIEELDTLSAEVNRISGSISYYLTLDINDYAVEGFTIQFVKVDTSLDLNTYDYFRYYTEGDTSRYCLFSIINESSSLHDNVPIVPTTVEEGKSFNDGDLLAKFDFEKPEGVENGEPVRNDTVFTNNGYELKVIGCSYALYGTFSTDYDVINLSLPYSANVNKSVIKFNIPENVNKVLVCYGNYSASYPAKIEVNGVELTGNKKLLNVTPSFASVIFGNDTRTLRISTTVNYKHASIDYIAFYK